jgi:hypothetical protein
MISGKVTAVDIGVEVIDIRGRNGDSFMSRGGNLIVLLNFGEMNHCEQLTKYEMSETKRTISTKSRKIRNIRGGKKGRSRQSNPRAGELSMTQSISPSLFFSSTSPTLLISLP